MPSHTSQFSCFRGSTRESGVMDSSELLLPARICRLPPQYQQDQHRSVSMPPGAHPRSSNPLNPNSATSTQDAARVLALRLNSPLPLPSRSSALPGYTPAPTQSRRHSSLLNPANQGIFFGAGGAVSPLPSPRPRSASRYGPPPSREPRRASGARSDTPQVPLTQQPTPNNGSVQTSNSVPGRQGHSSFWSRFRRRREPGRNARPQSRLDLGHLVAYQPSLLRVRTRSIRSIRSVRSVITLPPYREVDDTLLPPPYSAIEEEDGIDDAATI